MVTAMAQRLSSDDLRFAVGEMLSKSRRQIDPSHVDPDELKGEFCSWIEARAVGRTKKGLNWEKLFQLSQMSRRNRLSDRPPEQVCRLLGLREKATYLDAICAANFEFRSKTGLPGLC